VTPIESSVAIHCMQGRLLPPEDDQIQAFPSTRWAAEFERAYAAAIEGIEWIYEQRHEAQNPLGTDAGVAAITTLARTCGVVVESLVADWFMDRPLLVHRTDGLAKLRWLLGRARTVGIGRLVLPFVDSSALRGDDDVRELVALIHELTPELERAHVELHLETSLAPDAFARLLEPLDERFVKANYDSGNSASLGYDPADEFSAYGARIGSVHIKDRVLGGGTVPLGTGDTDLQLVAGLLRRQGWKRPLVLQVARGTAGDEVNQVRRDAEFVRALWARAGKSAWTSG
jgi:L-ribulose-5-phosphate 3-epimerase